jgi:hypothetical protein
MANIAKTNVEDLVSAIRKVAKELDCTESEERFQEVLFEIGRHKSVKPNASLVESVGKNKLARFRSS